MPPKNAALNTWLRRVGKVRRRIIYKKLWRALKCLGLTDQEVNKGLRQVIVKVPCVRIVRCRTPGLPRSGSKIEGRSTSSKKKQNRLDDGSPEALSTSSTAVDESEPVVAKRQKITKDDTPFCDIPELLDERAGNTNPFIVRIPRTAITLNLNQYNSLNGAGSKEDRSHSRPSTEIRLADSSVPDLAPNGNEESVVPVEKGNVTKKPKIIDDLTCVEGTILLRRSLKKFAEEPANATRKKRRPEVEVKSARNAGDDDATRKSRIREKFRCLFGNDVTLSESDEEKSITAKLTSRKRRNESRMSSDSGVCLNEHTSDMACTEALEKQRDNENPGEFPRDKLRKNSKDLGEYTKENRGEYPRVNTKVDLTENTKKYLREYRREKLRKNPREHPEEYNGKNRKTNPEEYNGKDPKECPRENSIGKPREFPSDDLRGKSIGETRKFLSDDLMNNSIGKVKEVPSEEDPREILSMKKEDTEVESAQVLSMPLLESVCEKRAEEARDKALPDSSTSILEKMLTQPDSSSGGKLTILVTPLNVQDSDAFDPLRLEFDLSEEAQISTPTSTTSGPPIVEPIKLESSFVDRQNLVGTCVDDSCQIGDLIIVKEDFSPEAETESGDDDRLIIAEDLEPETSHTPRECKASDESGQRIIDTPILPKWRPSSISGPKENSSNESHVNSSSDSNATADKNMPFEKVMAETALEIREKMPNEFTSVIDASSSAHQKVLLISARIMDFDPASGKLVDSGESVKVSNETSPQTSESSSDQVKLKNYVSLTRPSNEATIVSNNFSTKLSEITMDDHSTGEQKSVNRKAPDSEIPKCVLEPQKPKDVPKAPNLRVLHPSELGSRWCPTPLATAPLQNQPQFGPSPAMTQARVPSKPANAQPRLYPPCPRYPNSQVLRNPPYPQICQPPPEVLIQTPPPSPLEQMQILVSQTSSSAHGVEDLSSKKPSGSVHVSHGPRPVHTGSGLSSSRTVDTHRNWPTPTSSPNAESPLERQHSLMSRIFECLISMASFIGRIRCERDMATILQIDKDYVAKKKCLFAELSRYAHTQGTNDLRTIVARIMNYYNYLVVPERRILHVEAVHYMLKLEHASMANVLYAPRPLELRPPPPYRPNRASVTQSSPFTESQRQLLYSQMLVYRHLHNVHVYQLVAQRRAEEEAAKTKRTRRRNPRAPAGQKQAVQASAAGWRERLNVTTDQQLRRLAPAPVDHPCTLQQTMEYTIEQIVRNEGVTNRTVTDKRREEIVELALRDASIDKTVENIVNDLFRQHPTERMAEGQAVQRTSQGQNKVGHIQGQSVDANAQGRPVDANVQGRRVDVNVQGQSVDVNVQDQRTVINGQGQTIGVTFQGQRTDSSVQGQRVGENVKFQAIAKNPGDKTIERRAQCQTMERNLQGQINERSVRGQAILDVTAQTNESNVQGEAMKKSVRFDTVKVNARAEEATEKKVQGQAIVEEEPSVESAFNRNTTSVEDGNTSVLDVLKEFEVLDSITRGPHSRVSRLSKSKKSPVGNEHTESIPRERDSKAADPTCPEDSPIIAETAARVDDGKTESGHVTSVDVEAGSSMIVPVITIEDDEDWDRRSADSVETVRDAEDATIVDKISILDVKSIPKDVFNNIGARSDEASTAPVARTNGDEEDDEGSYIKTKLTDCFQCGRRSEIVCEQCRLAAYCSSRCHQVHWSAIHHLTCRPDPQYITDTTEVKSA